MKLRYNPFLALLAIAPVAPAADYFYDSNGTASTAVGGTGTWSGSVWRNGSTTGTLGAWVDGNLARFSFTSTVTLDQNAAPSGINFGGINCDIRGSGSNALTFSGGIITNSATTSGFQGHDLTGLLGGSVIFNPTSGTLASAATFIIKANNTGLTSVALKAETTTAPITALPNANVIVDDVGAFGAAGTPVKLTSGVVNIGALTSQLIGSAVANGSGGSLNLNAWNTELAGGSIRSRVGNNTWNGPVEVTANSSLLTRPAAAVKLTLTGDIDLNANTLTLSPTSPSDGIVLSGDISGTGGITQANSALTSAGSAAATTTSTISGTNTYSGPTQVSVGRLNLTGSLTSDLTMATGTALLGEGSTTGALNFDTTNDFLLDPNTPATHFEAGSINAATSTVAIKLTSPSPVVTDMVVMESTGGPINASISNFTFTGRGSLSFNPGGTQLLFTYTPATLVWKGNQIDPTFWDGITANWLNSGTPVTFQANDLVLFNDTATSFDVSVQATSVEPGSITFDNSANNYTLGGSPIAGVGTFTKNGTGKVTITNDNTFTGLATINAGTVALGDGSGTTGNLGSNPLLTNNASLETNFNATEVLTQVISGTGSLTQKGFGTVVLAADNTYSGGTTIDAGATLQIGNGGLFGSVVGDIVTNGALNFNRVDGGTFANNISGRGGISKALNTGSTATITGNNTFDGDVEIAGSIAAGSTTALGSTVGVTTISAAGGRLELVNGLTISGETIYILGGGATFNGALMAQAAATATWNGPVVLNSTDTRLGAGAGGTLIVNGDISDGVGSSLGISAGVGSTATVRLTGSTKSYTGATNIRRGVLQLGASNVLPATTALDVDNVNAAENASFDLNGFNQTVATIRRTSTGGGTGTGTITNTSATASTLTVNQSVSNSYIGRLTGNLSLVQTGTGTLTLAGDQAEHLGNTTVNGSLILAAGSPLTLTPTSNGVTNSIGGNGTIALDGKLTLNLGATDATHGNSWNLIDVGSLTETYNETTFSVDSSLGAFTESVDTPGTWKLVSAPHEWTFVESSGVLSVGPSDPFNGWINSFFPGETNAAIIGSLADPDGDGLTNEQEYAAYSELGFYGTNPALADTDGDSLSDGYELGIGRFSIVSGSFTWQQARNDAQSRGGDLACFPTESRWNRALQGLGVNPFDEFTGLWIGASDAAVDGTWTWVNGEAFNFAPWGTSRPSSTIGNTLDFAEVSGGGGPEIGKWYDRSANTIRDGYLLETGYATSPTVADADGDGLNDGQEQAAGTSPTTADTDGDGLSDGQEVNLSGTNPKLPDTDGDGANDAGSDEDSDGLTNLAEIATYGTNPQEADTDDDGLSDSQEVNIIGTDPKLPDTDGNGSNDAESDQDGDGLGNLAEITPYDTDPLNTDTDGDGLSDGQEVNLSGTNPKLPDTDGDGTNDAGSDEDGDGLSNLAEITTYGTNPQEADTDGDGLFDSAELNHPGRYFSLIEGSFTHAQASADAATRRGRLASFPNASDFTRMAARARKTTQSYLWLGLSDAATEGTWLWTDGSTPTYARWLNGQPDGGPAENHAVLMENSNQWADAVAEFVAAGYLFERVGLDPLAADTDSDGLSDGAEINTHQTSPVLDDSDSDGLSDGAEINTHGSNPKLADTDSDGLSDFAEVVTHGTNPSVKDSDGDGFDDLFEINTGFNPTQQASTPDALSSIRTAVEFRFNASNGASYRIEGSTDLQNWETVETGIVGTGGVVTRFYSIENQPKRYFRVVKIGGSSDPGGDGI